MQTTRNTEKTTRTAREIAEVQRDSYEALAENFAAAQRRTIGLAEGGLRVHEVAGAECQGGPGVVRGQREAAPAPAAQCRVRAGLDGRRRGGAARADRAQREDRRGLRAERIQAAGELSVAHPELGGSYRDFFSPFAYMQEGMKTTQQAAQQGLEATEQVARQGLRVAEEATEQTEKVLRKTEKATKEAELRTAVFGASEDRQLRRVDGR